MNNLHSSHIPDPVRDRVMDIIKTGQAHMKPRWHFVFMSALFALGVFCTLLVLLYGASLSMFLLRESGVWFAPTFGLRGWFALAQSVPLSHIAFILVFIFILEAMIRRYALVYRRPLIGSFVAVAALIIIGGVLIAQTPFHRQIASFARGHELPAPLNIPYGPSVRVALPADLYEGAVVAKESGLIVIEHASDGDSDADDGHHIATTTPMRAQGASINTTTASSGPDIRTKTKKQRTRIIITPHTHLPHHRDFEIGSTVVVQGDRVGTDTVDAFGVRDIDE